LKLHYIGDFVFSTLCTVYKTGWLQIGNVCEELIDICCYVLCYCQLDMADDQLSENLQCLVDTASALKHRSYSKFSLVIY